MKNIKNLLGLLTITLLVFSCNVDDSEAITASETAGLIVNIDDTSGKILGSPASGVDLADAEIAFTAVDLDFDAKLQFGNESGVSKYEIIKTFNDGAEVLVAETTSLPFNITYSSIDEYLSGFSVAVEDIRIGDEFTFKVKLHKTNGTVLYFGDRIAAYTVVVNCSSDLAGTYAINYSSGPANHFVTELSPGLYQIHSMMGWPTSTYAVKFTDTCGILSMLNDWQFSNVIYAEGFVDNDGNIVWSTSGVENVYDDSAWTMIKQ